MYNLESKSANERSNNASEKDARATIYGAVKRVLSNKDVVILDGGNYIKGWRYQLFCEAKAMRTGCCVLHVGVPADKAKEVNEARLERRDLTSSEQSVGEVQIKEEDKAYEKDNWENLVFRYEEPNAMVRWDSPLFTVVWEDENVPGDAIWDAIIGDDSEGKRKIVRPNAATVAKVHSSEGFLYELDKTTQTVLNRVLEWSKDHPGEGGGEISVGENSKGDELVVELPGDPVGLPTLQRLRRQFISLQRTNPVTVERIKETFVRYLNDSFEA